ncbi:hypothetical protein [Aureimonas sp. AU4]|uniref:hypothetical protein n=1 Tax=Aureimonas sp. AU4 TaxID=1638163 RepID=UPI000782F1A8|nr:hypothetical protein [Aureimonas sp. AU4]
MIKVLAIGLWVCAATLGSSWLAANLRASEAPQAPKKADFFEGLDYRKTDSIAVPLIADNAIKGYALARFVYTIDGALVASLAVPPEPVIIDEAFRAVYSVSGFDFDHPERYDLAALVASVKSAVNARYGRDVVEDVMVDQFDFLPKSPLGVNAEVKAAQLP